MGKSFDSTTGTIGIYIYSPFNFSWCSNFFDLKKTSTKYNPSAYFVFAIFLILYNILVSEL